jgi:hypothetical protein
MIKKRMPSKSIKEGACAKADEKDIPADQLITAVVAVRAR